VAQIQCHQAHKAPNLGWQAGKITERQVQLHHLRDVLKAVREEEDLLRHIHFQGTQDLLVSRDISAEKSTVDGQPSGSVIINQTVSFKVIVVDKKGNRVTSSPKGKGIIPFVVEITFNGNQAGQQVKIQDIQGKEGEFSVSFTPTTAGQHQISVSHKGKHFKGSPFRIDVLIDPRMTSLVIHMVLLAIQGVISLLLNMAITECKYLTRQACSCSNSDLKEMDSDNDRVSVLDSNGQFLRKFVAINSPPEKSAIGAPQARAYYEMMPERSNAEIVFSWTYKKSVAEVQKWIDDRR